MSDIDILSPEASPNSPSKPGIKRVNNMPLIIAIGILLLFLIMIALVASTKGNKKTISSPSLVKKSSVSALTMAEDVLQAEHYAALHQQAIKLETLKASNISEPEKIIKPHQKEKPAAPSQHILLDANERDHIKTLKLQQFEKAITASTKIDFAKQSQGALSNFDKKIQSIRQKIAHAGDSNYSNENYSDNINNNNWQLDSKVTNPKPFEIKAGDIIPGIMITGINSELPGQIMGQVAHDVYDSRTGKYTLIPQGTKLVGNYTSDIAYGQTGILVAWQRLVFPDGKALDIGNMPGSDAQGYSGLRDKTNNHYLKIFGSAVLMSGITAGVTLSQKDKGAGEDASSALSEALGQQLGQVASQMIAKNLNIAPTLEIRPGYRFNVVVTKDLNFDTPYQHFVYS